MSRRLDISALLCNDDDEVVLAPHLKARPPPPIPQPRPQHVQQRPFEPPKPAGFVGFDALVHAATEERRRLSGGELAHQQHQPHPQPQHHHHLQQPQPQQQPQQPPRISHRSPWPDEQHYPPQPIEPPRHSFDDRGHQMRPYPLLEHKRAPSQHELDRINRAHEIDRQRQAEKDRLADLERKNMVERQKMEEERRLLEEERMRLLQLERRLQEQEAARRREDEEREERRRQDEERRQQDEERRREREVAAIREAERREQQRQAEMQLQRKQHEELQQQRMYGMQRADMERQRRHQHHIQQQQQQQAQQQQAQQHQLQQQQAQQQQAQQQQQQQQQQYAFHHHRQQSPQLHRQYEPPPRIEIPPGPQHPVRKIDQSPPTKLQSESPHLAPDQRPAKKARYSDSPSLPPIVVDDKDRIARERERMTVGEIGYGRIESPVAVPPSSSSSSSARPNSGNGFRRPVSVSDLLSPEPQPPLLPTPIEPHQPPLRIISREKDPAPHHNRILSPLGRRSPPGSQVGRAKAARKSDEHGPAFQGLAPSVSSSNSSTSVTPALVLSQPPPPPGLPTKKPIVKEEHGVRRQKIEELLTEVPKKTPVPAQVMRESPSASISHQQQPHRPLKHPQQQQGDAHDWLLEHYAQPSPTSKKDTHHRHAPPRSPTAPRRTLSPIVQVKKQSPSPTMQDENDDALEQELEELLAEVNIPAKEEAMDVDSVVAELVAETLEGDDEELDEGPSKNVPYQQDQGREKESMPLAADVEDELLSLIDDRLPPPALSSSAARRASGSSASTTPLAPPSNRPTKQSPTSLRAPESATTRQTSPPVPSPISSLLSPALRPDTTKPKSERGSMPPPPIVSNKEEALKKKPESVPAPASGSAGGSKKKKDVAASKPKTKAKATVGDAAKPISISTEPPEKASTYLPPKPRAKPVKSKKALVTLPKAETGTPSPTIAPLASTSKSTTAPTKTNNVPATAPRKNTTASAASRSRSTSVMPGIIGEDGAHTPSGSVVEDRATKAEKQEEEEDSDAADEDDNRLYCVCKTKYDQERCMIACDRCDEWYHMQCVDMPEAVADLVDQFFCPPCIEKNPTLSLRTTYKQRCLWGLKHPDPSSSRACHKPARGAFSKYCSDECGVKYMQSRIDTWAKKGGKKDKLWESVKSAEKREGVVVRVDEHEGPPPVDECQGKIDDDCKQENGTTKDPIDLLKNGHLKPAKPAKTKTQREKERLTRTLEQVVRMGNELKKGMEVLIWREKLLELASERSESQGLCGWDQRLCFGDEEWADQGQSVLESYEDRGEGDMDVDSEAGEGDWWCVEEAACSRHMGWQTTRYKDICKEKEKKEEALQKMTARENEIRKRLEDITNPLVKRTATSHQERNGTVKAASAQAPLSSANAKLSNGHGHKSKASGGDMMKKGKKRKNPAS